MQEKKIGFWNLMQVLLSITLSLGIWACASTGSPTGGPKDILPPKLDTTRSSRSGQVFFKPRVLTFYFDEFVEVKDVIKQVLVSPPLTYIPKVTHRGKRVSFAFDEKEVLKEDATYTLNFGEAISDYHEGNVLSPFTFVFSTGAVLDSLSLKGSVRDAKTGELAKDVVVFLYDNLTDSIVRKEKPLYFARPDKDGLFQFLNIKSDTFRILAIKDENLNYKYDLDTEKVGFLDSLLILSDKKARDLDIRLSLPEPKGRILASGTRQFGKVNLLYNTMPPESIPISVSDKTMPFAVERILDSLNLYYNTSLDSFFVYAGGDTIKVKPRGKEEFLKKSKFILKYTSPLSNIPARDSVALSFNVPLGDFSPDKVKVMDSIGMLDRVDIRLSNDRKSIEIRYPWVPGEKYTISLARNSFQSLYGMWNDSIGLTATILPVEKTAGLKVLTEGLDSAQTYLISVLREQFPIFRCRVNGISSHTINLKGLAPDKYTVEVIEDKNDNGRWDAGDYWQQRQPEPYMLFKGDKLRENWDSEMKISVADIRKGENEPKRQSEGLPLRNPLEPRKK